MLGVILPPVGLLAWIGLSGSSRAEYFRSTWVRAGLGIVAVSVAPLLVVVTLASLGLWPDPDPNPIGLGLLLVAGGAFGTIVAAVGVLLVGRH